MNKYRFIVISMLFFSWGDIFTQCPYVNVSLDASLPNPCISYKARLRLYNNIGSGYAITLNTTLDFGDGSPVLINSYYLPAYTDTVPTITHIYNSPGTYILTLTTTGPGTCVITKNVTVVVSGHCETCPTFSNLSTGFDRINNVVFSIAPGSPGSFDPYWSVIKREGFNLGYPTGVITYYANISAYDIYPNIYDIGPIGTSGFISENSTVISQYPTANIVTFRTYFNLPSPLLASKIYSLAVSSRADDRIYDILLNGTSLLPGYTHGSGEAYSGPSVDASASSTTANLFLPGSNYIDISLLDLCTGYTQLNAEILLYDKSLFCFCSDCISSFAPTPGKKYLISAWAKEKNAPQSKTSYTNPSIDVTFPSISGSAGPFTPSGNIIDGWQRIEGEFTLPSNAINLGVSLSCLSGDCYYDDIRIFPFDGTMKSYVYDPVNMRLVAELDERNYATLYEYDEEGKLIRVKKETEKGKMTIKENRDNSKK